MKVFGLVLAAGAVGTSVATIILGCSWEKTEASVYAGARHPAWFWVVSTIVIALYVGALISFIRGDSNRAGWILGVTILAGWVMKGGLVTFNARSRQTVPSISGDEAWFRVGLARLPIAVVLGLLAWFA
ncbi:MAG: hypothetical protein ACM309_06115 [Bacillota bacterium]